jgi:hypothetical protein
MTDRETLLPLLAAELRAASEGLTALAGLALGPGLSVRSRAVLYARVAEVTQEVQRLKAWAKEQAEQNPPAQGAREGL